MGQIRADLNLNCDKFLAAIRTVDNAVEHLEHNIVGFVAGFKGLQIAGEAIESQFEHLKQSLELGATLREVSLNTNQTVSDVMLLRQVFENSGMGAEFAEQAIFNLNKSLAGVNEAGEPTKGVFEKLGLSIQALRSLSTVDQLKMLGEAFRNIENPADRARAAADLFGKSGKRMMQIFGEPEAFAIAATQIGGLGETMEANAKVFKEIEDEMGALNLKAQQLWAGIAQGSAGELKETLESLRSADLSELGESIGGVITNALHLAKVLWEIRPILIGIGAAMAANTIASSRWGEIVRNATREAIGGFGGLNAAVNTFSACLVRSEGAMAKLAFTGRVAFASLAAGAKALYTALGPIGWGIMLGTAAMQAIHGRADRINNASSAVKSIGEEKTSQARQNFAEMNHVSSEGERATMAEKLAKQLEEVHEKIRQVNEDFSDEKGFDDAGRARITEEYEAQAHAIELQERSLGHIPQALLDARAAAKHEAEALEEARKKAEQLTEEVAKGRQQMESDIAKASFDELTPQQQKDKTLSDVGASSAEDIEQELEQLDKVIELNNEQGKQSDRELERQMKLIEARRALIGIEKAIKKEREDQEQKDQAAKEKKQKQDARYNDFERDWKLEVAKTQAEIRGDDAGVKRIEHQQRVNRYEKEAIDVGEDPALAHKMAEARATADDTLAAKKEADKEKSAPQYAVGHLRSIGGGGVGFGASDPLLRESQRQSQALRDQLTAINRTNSLLESLKTAPPSQRNPVFGSGYGY